MNHFTRYVVFAFLATILTTVSSCRTTGTRSSGVEAFATPQAAGDALVAALKKNDKQALARMFGEGSALLLTSGDPVADEQQRERFVSKYDQKHSWDSSDKGVAVLDTGADGWPFPIPLMKDEAGWRFDTEQGSEEILNRRIGRNELDTIQSCLAFVDAEREYYQRNPRSLETPEYARFILSSKGEKNGLYWETSTGEAPSPLGPLYGAARSQGYSPTQGGRKPYHGYLYRVLHAQGPNAPGGAYDYMHDGEMTRGFALLAWPAKYGASGVTTFLVNQVGVLYEKDLGPDTKKIVSTLTVFDPDKSWFIVPAEAQTLPDS
ncbi:MAG: DUF2950 domain-containing protein [Myxococcota bacterium]